MPDNKRFERLSLCGSLPSFAQEDASRKRTTLSRFFTDCVQLGETRYVRKTVFQNRFGLGNRLEGGPVLTCTWRRKVSHYQNTCQLLDAMGGRCCLLLILLFCSLPSAYSLFWTFHSLVITCEVWNGTWDGNNACRLIGKGCSTVMVSNSHARCWQGMLTNKWIHRLKLVSSSTCHFYLKLSLHPIYYFGSVQPSIWSTSSLWLPYLTSSQPYIIKWKSHRRVWRAVARADVTLFDNTVAWIEAGIVGLKIIHPASNAAGDVYSYLNQQVDKRSHYFPDVI